MQQQNNYSISFAKKLADVADILIKTEPANLESRRATVYLSRVSLEISLKSLLEGAGFSVKEIRDCSHNVN